MAVRAGFVLILASSLPSLAAATPAAGATRQNGASYKRAANAICRSFTPKAHSIDADVKRAEKRHNAQRVGYDFGALIAVQLAEDAQLEQLSVPADIKAQMARPLKLLRAIDAEGRRVFVRSLAGDPKALMAEIAKLVKIAKPLDRSLDRVGLRDCGSNQ